ncbi:MAG: hypothetical protein ACK5IP_14645 [Paracoccus sp. (in: a-proteobacteria)]
MATESDFDREISALRGAVEATGAGMGWDDALRGRYRRLIAEMSREVKAEVRAGRLTWDQASRLAYEQRNVIMDHIRSRSTPVGRAYAERLKRQAPSIERLLAKNSVDLFGPGAQFDNLSAGQRDQVLRRIVESAGRSNARVNGLMRNVSRAGRGLLVLSISIAVYNVATAEDKGKAAAEEGALLGGGILGGAAGGALAGAVCGPGALICSSIGAFAGAVAGAFGASLFF